MLPTRPSAATREGGSARRAGELRLGRVLGVPVLVGPSWPLLLVLLALAYRAVLDRLEPAPGPVAAWAAAVAVAVGLLASVVLHELGHLAVARALRLGVAAVRLHLLGGLTEVLQRPGRAGDEAALALAGPLVSVALGGVSAAAAASAGDGAGGQVLATLALVNALLALFNVLPGTPLDGGRMLSAAVWGASGDRGRGALSAARAGQVLAVGVGLCAVVLPALVDDVPTALLLSGSGAVVAAFLWTTSRTGVRLARLERRLPSLVVRRLLRRALAVGADVPVAEAVRRARADGALALVVVDPSGRPRGLVAERAVDRLDPARRPWTPVRDLARDLLPGHVLAPDLAGQAVLDALRAQPAGEYLVTRGGTTDPSAGDVLGVVSADDVAAALGVRRPRPARAASTMRR